MTERNTGEDPFSFLFREGFEERIARISTFREDLETMSDALRESTVTEAEFFHRITTTHQPETGAIIYIDEDSFIANGGEEMCYLETLTIEITPDRKLRVVDNSGELSGIIGLSKKGRMVARVAGSDWLADNSVAARRAWGNAMITSLKSVRPLQ